MREIERIEHHDSPQLSNQSANDNRRPRTVTFGRSLFPRDAVARIFKPGRSVMTSGKAQTRGWRLVFEHRTAPYIEPLMGWTGGDDTLTQVELSFPTLEKAIAYAKRQGLAYVVDGEDSQWAVDAENGRARTTSEQSVWQAQSRRMPQSRIRAPPLFELGGDAAGVVTWATVRDAILHEAVTSRRKEDSHVEHH